MSQDLSGGGRRGAAQRDKEFFPAGKVAKAKYPTTGKATKAIKASGERVAGSEPAAGNIGKKRAQSAASLLLSASSASTIAMIDSSDDGDAVGGGAPADPFVAINPAAASASASLFKRALGGIRPSTLPPAPQAAKVKVKETHVNVVSSDEHPETTNRGQIIVFSSDQSSDSSIKYMGVVGAGELSPEIISQSASRAEKAVRVRASGRKAAQEQEQEQADLEGSSGVEGTGGGCSC